MAVEKSKKKKIAWGITGGGDKIAEFLEVMEEVKREYQRTVEIHVFLSKAAETVLKYYRLEDNLREKFRKVSVELNSNVPFLAGWMQIRKYEFLLIAPATSNTVAKIANGIGDSLLSNATIMSLKAFIPVYIVPTDYRESIVHTKLPNGKEMMLRIRKEDVSNVKRLQKMDDIHVLENAQIIPKVFRKWFRKV